mmetsp:Transcript_2974/g.8414  ORF Transcript_2974/g.8414 Transcript_2974/m.8414 type:complete len:231 (+) Transcript_2974:121-813(+)
MVATCVTEALLGAFGLRDGAAASSARLSAEHAAAAAGRQTVAGASTEVSGNRSERDGRREVPGTCIRSGEFLGERSAECSPLTAAGDPQGSALDIGYAEPQHANRGCAAFGNGYTDYNQGEGQEHECDETLPKKKQERGGCSDDQSSDEGSGSLEQWGCGFGYPRRHGECSERRRLGRGFRTRGSLRTVEVQWVQGKTRRAREGRRRVLAVGVWAAAALPLVSHMVAVVA